MTAMSDSREEHQAEYKKAILAGGCFWGMQDLIRKQPGVVSTRVGYTGGQNANATYRNHPGHAEAIEIIYDPSQTDFRNLLEFFFQIHDPTTKNRQGNDVGTSYRSAIFYVDDEQKRVALDTIADVDASGLWPGKVVTEVTPASDFWEAEPEHQDYLERYPSGYTCHFPRSGLEATEARAGPTRMGPRERKRDWGQGSLGGRGLAAAHHDAAAVLGCEGDAPEMDLLVRGVVGLNNEVLQHRSQHDIHLDVGERGPDAAPGSAAERHPRRRWPGADEPVRIEALGIREDVGIGVHVGDRDHHGVAVRNPPFAEIEVRRRNVAAGEVDHGPVPLQLEDCGLAELVAALVVFLDELGEDIGMAAQPLERPPQGRRSGLVSGAQQRQQFVGDVLARHRAAVLVSAAQQQREDVGALVEARVGLGLLDQRRIRCGRSCGGTPRAGPTGCSGPCLNGGSGRVAIRDPSLAHGGIISRR